MTVDFFTSSPFSIEYRSTTYDLDKNDVNKIILATVVGSIFLLIGAPIAFSVASYYFRKRKFEQLSEDPKFVVIRENFLKEMNRTMGANLLDYQKETLSVLFEQAIKTDQPKASLDQLIRSKCNQVDGWRNEKMGHICKNLLRMMPPSTDDLDTELTEIAQTHIDSIGKKLVCFYKTGPTAFLGNFFECPVTIFEQRFKCAEAAFQWLKYHLSASSKRNEALSLRLSEFFKCNGEEAFQLNRQLKEQFPGVLDPNWDVGLRDKAMWKVLTAKFGKNKELFNRLKMTEDAYLLEHNEVTGRDEYWSDNHDGAGKNMLGHMLMAIREGCTCPQPAQGVDPQIQKYAQYANEKGALNYQIF